MSQRRPQPASSGRASNAARRRGRAPPARRGARTRTLHRTAVGAALGSSTWPRLPWRLDHRNGDRAIVDEMHLHVGAKAAGRHERVAHRRQCQQPIVKPARPGWCRGARKARARVNRDTRSRPLVVPSTSTRPSHMRSVAPPRRPLGHPDEDRAPTGGSEHRERGSRFHHTKSSASPKCASTSNGSNWMEARRPGTSLISACSTSARSAAARPSVQPEGMCI